MRLATNAARAPRLDPATCALGIDDDLPGQVLDEARAQEEKNFAQWTPRGIAGETQVRAVACHRGNDYAA
jgi:hypothetical protein